VQLRKGIVNEGSTPARVRCSATTVEDWLRTAKKKKQRKSEFNLSFQTIVLYTELKRTFD
jgi:hypothetical protein